MQLAPSLFQDESVFQKSKFPCKRTIRNNRSMKTVLHRLNAIKKGRSVRNLYIYGPAGTGKTSIVQNYLKQHLEGRSAYVDCWKNRTIHKIMNSIMHDLGIWRHGKESVSDLLKKFERAKSKRPVVVCLDESHYIQDNEILNFLAQHFRCVILVSTMDISLYPMDGRTRGNLFFEEIQFEPLNEQEIIRILQEHASSGLRSGAVNNSVLERIC